MIVVHAPSGAPAGMPLHPVLAAHAVRDDAWRRDAPDDHWLVTRDGVVVAHASLWWRHTPSLPGETVGLVGHYAAADADAGATLLRHAVVTLASRGCTVAIGPIDGSTWHAYRLVTARGTEPPYFLEPDTPDDWPAHFTVAGFAVLAEYTSALVSPIPPSPPGIGEVAARLDQQGYTLRAVDPARATAELDALYDVSIAAFAENFLYTPITRAAFHAQYAAILPRIDPRLVLLAEHAGVVVGYVFVVPDLLEQARTGRVSTAIVKTLAVHPAHNGRGLGGLLVDRVQRAAADLGFTRVIHALMFASNRSQQISRHYGAAFRRYALFSRATP
ncbi:MAG: GNAT family N-acetyltransferase [Vicinamibacterales bacterium]